MTDKDRDKERQIKNRYEREKGERCRIEERDRGRHSFVKTWLYRETVRHKQRYRNIYIMYI